MEHIYGVWLKGLCLNWRALQILPPMTLVNILSEHLQKRLLTLKTTSRQQHLTLAANLEVV